MVNILYNNFSMVYEARAITNRPYTALARLCKLLLKSNCLIQIEFMQLDFNVLIKFPILPKHQNKFTKKT